MAYGRLDVFWPDGLFRTYLLTDSTISLGRSPGNAIPLETDTLSRYHATITYKDGEVQVTDLDSANGTFVDGVKLENNQPRTLYGGEEITIGELRMIYHYLDETPTRPITVPEETTQRIELEEAPFYIEIDGPNQAIPPGAHISARLRITNTADQIERFRVEVSGVPKDWARMDRPDLEIAPEQTADVIVNFKPRRRSDSSPGDYVVQVSVYPKSKPEQSLKADVVLHLLPYGGFGMALERNRLTPGDRFKLHIHNQGSAPLPLNLIARDLGDSLTFTIPSNHMTLAPGQRGVIQGQATPKKTSFFGDAREHSFDLIMRSGDAASFTIATRAYVDEKPPLPSWAAFALGAGALAVAVVMLIGLILLLQPPPALPGITAFNLSSQRVAQGDPVIVDWAVQDTNEIHISVNGVEVFTERDGQTQTVQIDTTPLDGVVTVALVAANGGRQAEASATFEVYRGIRITQFTVMPPRAVLYVAQTLAITWETTGATNTQITGLDTFASTPLEAVYPATGTLSVVGIPRAPITITLNVLNEDTSIQQPFTLEVIPPQCTASGADVALRAAPDTREQVVGTIPNGQTVIVDAQDPLGQWLRVQLSGGAHGWGERTAFVCADTFSIDDLFKELIVPTARPEFTIVPALGTPVAPAAVGTIPATAAPPATIAPASTQVG